MEVKKIKRFYLFKRFHKVRINSVSQRISPKIASIINQSHYYQSKMRLLFLQVENLLVKFKTETSSSSSDNDLIHFFTYFLQKLFIWFKFNSPHFTSHQSLEEFEEASSIIRVFERSLSSRLEMFVVESKGGAIACMLVSLLFLGTWPAVLAFLERRGRLPQHSYLDYSITNLLAAVIIALTLGQIGDDKPGMPNFITQLYQNNWPSVLFAMAGGVVLSIGNLSTQYAWALVGLSVVEVVSASITVVIGTTLNYFLDDKINKADILFPGVACFLVAVILGSLVHSSNASDTKKKLTDKANKKGASMDVENGKENKVEAQFGTAEYLIELENKRSIKVFDRSVWLGLAITFFSGICFSLFSPAFNLATNDQFHFLEKGVPHLVVYTAFFYFSVCCFVVAIVLNIIFLYRPILNLPKSSFKAYVADSNGRGLALLAGLICGFGNGLQFMGGQAAGYAAADAVQALPLVSTFWAILLFGEYRKSSKRTYILLVSMLLMFIVAVGVLMASSGHRK